MGKDFLWIAGLGILGFAAFEYFKSSQPLAITTSSPVTTPQVSSGATILSDANVSGGLAAHANLTQADINQITNTKISNYGFLVDPNGVQQAQAQQWQAAYAAVTGDGYNYLPAFAYPTQNITFSAWLQIVQQAFPGYVSLAGIRGLGSIGKLRQWNNSNVSRYELIAAQFPRG